MSNSTGCKPEIPAVGQLRPFKVLLHNDNINTASFVLEKLIEILHLEEADALQKVKEAHETGISLIFVTHQERAEFICQQFQSYKITTTCEPE